MPDLRVAVVGPESSGKTTLALGLRDWLVSRGYETALVAEQGRLLAQTLPPGHVWSWREQRVTSLLHEAAEEKAALLLDQVSGTTILIVDGAAATPLVWHMSAVRRRPHYDAGPPEITEELLDAVERARYDVVLLTAPDLPWVDDGIRDDPDGRDEAFATYESLYPQAVVVAGEDRLAQAIVGVSGAGLK